uniref:Uncharacterized protein n=1 Tax=Pelusios castaneus TaxID=367368 RepID=A0A8C8SXT0_9SAUR
MDSRCWSIVLLFAVAAAAATLPRHKTQSYEEAIALAVDFYNQGLGRDHAFRLLKADPQPDWDMTSNPRQKLKFTVKETVCPVSENLQGTECDFRDNGVVRDCSGLFSTEQESPVVVISCDTVSQEHAPVRKARSPRRSWWPRHRGRYRTGSLTLIAQGGGRRKGSGTRMV